MFKVVLNGQEKEFSSEISLIDLIENNKYELITAKVNNKVRELSYKINQDCKVEFFGFEFEESIKIYEASLRFLFAMALKETYPSIDVRYSYNISRSILIERLDEKTFNLKMLKNINNKMNQIIEQDLKFVRKTMDKITAKRFYELNNMLDKVNVLDYKPEDEAHLYTCGNYENYVHSYLVYSTKYLNKFKLVIKNKKMYMQYPRFEEKGNIPEFKNEKMYGKTLLNSKKWAELINASEVYSINKKVKDDDLVEFVNMAETRHNNQLCKLGEIISKNKNIRLIAIAGPSSSGKTTFSDRLAIELKTRGKKPIRLSIDDYYIDRDKVEKDENGKIDLEHLNALNVDLFNENLSALIKGEEVQLPHFDFNTGKSVDGEIVKVDHDGIIIIEGIHALNEKLTLSISKKQKFLIYIAPHIQINIDNHSPVSTTNLRLIRRLVRDKKFRNSTAMRTISMWESVRKGEFTWIYQNQEKADFVFNSELAYEMCVLKKYALEVLKEIEEDNEFFYLANRLVKFLKYFKDIDDSYVPNNSLLREFIGGSCFSDV